MPAPIESGKLKFIREIVTGALSRNPNLLALAANLPLMLEQASSDPHRSETKQPTRKPAEEA